MSEAQFEAAEDAHEDDAPEIEDAADEDAAGREEADEGDEGEERPKRRQDAEAQLHNLKGQNARERSRRRAAEQKARELEDRLSRVEARDQRPQGNDLLELIGGLSDDENDPVGDIAAVKRALKVFRAQQLEDAQQEGQKTQIARQFQKLRDSMADSEADFRADFTDYDDAAKFYREQRQGELEDAGYTGQALQRKLADDLFGVVRMALDAGHDPAERVYALAKRRGFAAGQSSADKKVDVLNRAAAAGRKPSGGVNGAGALSWGDVAKLDGAARDKAFAKLRERERARR